MCNALTHASLVCDVNHIGLKENITLLPAQKQGAISCWSGAQKIETVYSLTLGNYLDVHIHGNFIIDEAKWAGIVDVQRPTLSVIFKLSSQHGMRCDLRVPRKHRLITKAVSLPKAYEI